MIYVICGKPGDGKSQYAVSLLLALSKENKRIAEKIQAGETLKPKEEIRPLYADIDGLKLDGVDVAPKDWRDTPDGAIIFYDEVHYRKEYEDLTGKYSQDPMIKELSTHRHQNKDLYLITQDAKRLERSVRGLVDAMYYVKRPQNKPPFATIYTFDKFYNDPAAASNAKKEHDSKMFKFKDEYQALYESASAHTSMSFKVQRKFIYAGIAILIMMGFAIKLFLASGFIDLAKKATDTDAIKSIGKVPEAKDGENSPIAETANLGSSNSANVSTAIDPEGTRIAMVISTDKECIARNGYGEVIEHNTLNCFNYANKPSLYMSSSRNPKMTYDQNKEVISEQQL
ncbi:zonular occludens toxin domain-containing protein [Acinetobacter nosocomialis]|uniref:zonular occludens toxin domain-containing protein n=1 Tax=Acinetobacter nosocomialis TaxID=106654 RepID=UPI0025A01A29|nr:zonular occludens toxin domain-containing protein [Acinetobacter nosocomialis]